MENKQVMKFKIPVLALTILSILSSILMTVEGFFSYDWEDYGRELDLELPSLGEIVGWGLWMLPLLVLTAYLLLHKQSWAKFLVPATFVLMTLPQFWGILLRFYYDLEGMGIYHLLPESLYLRDLFYTLRNWVELFSMGYLFAPLTMVCMCLLMAYAGLKGFSNKALVVAPALFLLWYQLGNTTGFVSDMLYCFETERYLYLLTTPIVHVAYLSFYAALVLFAIGHTFEPILKGKKKEEAPADDAMEAVAE